MPDEPSLSNTLSKSIMSIPSILVGSFVFWPVAISYAGVNYVEGMILRAIPEPGGTGGVVLNSVLRGWVQAVNMLTWDMMKSNSSSALFPTSVSSSVASWLPQTA